MDSNCCQQRIGVGAATRTRSNAHRLIDDGLWEAIDEALGSQGDEEDLKSATNKQI